MDPRKRWSGYIAIVCIILFVLLMSLYIVFSKQ